MRKVIYSMQLSLDGFIAGPDGDISWSVPDEELHRFHNEQSREVDVLLYGRRLYEIMRYWETVEENHSTPEHELEFARIWKRTPKLVFSRTLERVEGDARLVRGDIAAEVAGLRRQPGDGVLAVGGAGLAASFAELGLIDEYRLFLIPVLIGAGKRFFPATDRRTDLQLVESRTFGAGATYLRYRRRGDGDEGG